MLLLAATGYFSCAGAQGYETSVPATADFSEAPVVIFVCEHGSSKSLVAASLFNRMAEQRGSSVRALSRAVSSETVDTKVSPRLVQSMSGDGFNVETFRPRALSSAEAARAASVVVIGYEGKVESAGAASVERWNDIPPASLQYDSAKKGLTSHIDLLLRTLDAGKGKSRPTGE